VTHQVLKTLALTFVLSQLLASHIALAQANLPDNASSTAHKKVADNVDPSVMAEVDRMKAEQKARSDESRNNFPAASQSNAGISLFVPPSTPVIVVVETEDGELAATEF
jgi:hypothetical protein